MDGHGGREPVEGGAVHPVEPEAAVRGGAAGDEGDVPAGLVLPGGGTDEGRLPGQRSRR